MTPASRTALALAAVALALLGGCATAPPVPPAPPAPPAPSAPAEPDETGGAGNASAAPADAGGEGYTNTVRWTTASEVDNFGFDVFRSESEDGPFERLNDEVIEGAGTPDEPHR